MRELEKQKFLLLPEGFEPATCVAYEAVVRPNVDQSVQKFNCIFDHSTIGTQVIGSG